MFYFIISNSFNIISNNSFDVRTQMANQQFISNAFQYYKRAELKMPSHFFRACLDTASIACQFFHPSHRMIETIVVGKCTRCIVFSAVAFSSRQKAAVTPPTQTSFLSRRVFLHTLLCTFHVIAIICLFYVIIFCA